MSGIECSLDQYGRSFQVLVEHIQKHRTSFQIQRKAKGSPSSGHRRMIWSLRIGHPYVDVDELNFETLIREGIRKHSELINELSASQKREPAKDFKSGE